jgi:hypothetical protein
MAKRTDAYEFTFHPTDWNDIKRLREFKQLVKNHNKNSSQKLYVKMQGRLGKDNPSADKYRGKGFNAYQTIRKADASYFDVYLYERKTW